MLSLQIVRCSGRSIISFVGARSRMSNFNNLPKRLCSSEKLQEMKQDYKVDGLDRWILYKFGPKNKYASSAAVPKTVARAEIESAKSKFRIMINILAIAALVITASYLIHVAKGNRAKAEAEVVAKQKSLK